MCIDVIIKYNTVYCISVYCILYIVCCVYIYIYVCVGDVKTWLE